MYDIAVISEIKLNLGEALYEECTAANTHMVYRWTPTSVYGVVEEIL